jgi:hypothetical protein
MKFVFAFAPAGSNEGSSEKEDGSDVPEPFGLKPSHSLQEAIYLLN